ncbi:MAG: glycosyltransferase, partial [Candidatus Omnitrophota bacterium]
MKKTSSCPDVSVVVVNHNGKKYLERCFSSLEKLDYKKSRLQFIMVDNCSSDGSADLVRKKFPSVKVLHNDVNNYAKANNMGIKFSDSEYAALLNNDTYVDKKWLAALVNAAKKEDRVGCAGSKVLFPDGRIQSTGHYEFPNFYWGDRGIREPNMGQYELPKEVDSLSGSSVLFRRKCLDDVGFLDEDFVMYMEDVDLFLRCRDKGWKLMYEPKSVVYHEFHGTADNDKIERYVERNRLLLIAKHFPEKLSEAMYGKGFFLKDNKNELISMLPEVFFKIFKTHGRDKLEKIIPDIFNSLQKNLNLAKDSAVQSAWNELAILKGKFNEKEKVIADLDSAKSDIERTSNIVMQNLINHKNRVDIMLNERIAEIDNLKKEASRLAQELRAKEKDILGKDAAIAGQLSEIDNLKKEAEGMLSDRRAKENLLKEKTEESNKINDVLLDKLTNMEKEYYQRVSYFEKDLLAKDGLIVKQASEIDALKKEASRLTQEYQVKERDLLNKDAHIAKQALEIDA